MSNTELRALIGTALLDHEFCKVLLSENRHTSLMKFDLTNKEREVISSIKVDSIQEFVIRLYEWLTA